MSCLRTLVAFTVINTIFVNGLNRFSEPQFKAINFAEAIEGRKLNGSVIKELEVTSEMSCQFECVVETRCLSYNLISIEGKETSTCQLSDSDRFVNHMNFTSEHGVIYRGIQVITTEGMKC